MAADLTPLTAPADTATDGPFVRALIDKDSGRIILGLDRDAADALFDLLDQVVSRDLSIDPGVFGLDQATADRLDAVRSAITGPIAKLLGLR
ncbi:hypothetical protein [Micromonospora sp. RP3T]|uniref:hypothetical protein n=1 Tax=Micromonospora sp. RP3T TaxID=2135446 RepID=UPI003D755294